MYYRDCRDDVREKLKTMLMERPEDLVRLFIFLDEVDNANNYDCAKSAPWRNLKSFLYDDRPFEYFAEQYISNTKTAQNNQEYLEKMQNLYEQMLNSDRLKDDKAAILHIPTDVLNVLQQKIDLIAVPTSMFVMNRLGGLSHSEMAKLQIGYEAILNLYKWWNGEISGKRCAKNIVDASMVTVGSMGGATGGALLGTYLFPGLGTYIGYVTGSYLGKTATECLSDRLTTLLFDLPKDVAVERAYTYFGLHHTASNEEVNQVYRLLVLKYHPDKKGGSVEKFLELQAHMAVIKLAKKEELW